MAIVTGPCFSTWASGQLGKSIVFVDDIGNQQFVVKKLQMARGRPSAKQKLVRQIFADRARAAALFTRNYYDFMEEFLSE